MRVHEWIDSPSELLQWAGPMFSYPLDETQARDHLAVTKQSQPTRLVFTARDATDQLMGYLELDRIDRQNRTARVSWVIVALDARGEGYGTAMVRRVLDVGFEEIDLHRVGLLGV